MSFKTYLLIQKTLISHWDIFPKIISLHYYTTLEGVLDILGVIDWVTSVCTKEEV